MKSHQEKITVTTLARFKSEGVKISMATAYDYPSAALLDAAGIDLILVGDSLGMVVQGHKDTLGVTLDNMIYHSEMVARATHRALVVVDLPFPFCQLGPEEGVRASARIMKETGADAVKIEGGAARAETVRAVVEAGIPVMGHCGLMPQNVHALGGYKIERNRERLLKDANAIQNTGVFSLLFECVPHDLATELTKNLVVPTIGIGAGNGCDGQVLVFHDFLLYDGRDPEDLPRHARAYASVGKVITDAVKQYIADVKSGDFPSEKEAF